MSSHWKNLGILKERYDIPLEAIVKSDLLRMGISFSDQTLQKTTTCKAKSYFIFSFDRALQKDLSSQARNATPEEIALSGGPENFKRTIVSVRLNPKSPYHVSLRGAEATKQSPCGTMGDCFADSRNDRLSLYYNDEKICDVSLPERPTYYKEKLKDGKPVSDIAPTIEWGYLIYITAFRLCQYWGSKEECQFCDINENYRQQKKKRSYTAVKTIEEVLEALSIIQTNDTQKISRAYTVSGGSITTNLSGKTESTFYASYAQAIEKKFPGRWIGKANVQALVLDDVKKLKEAGYQIYHPNYEVWDQNLFRTLSPGKERHVGRAEWIKRTLDAAEVFGPSHVIPNFVAGVEMSAPYGFKTVPEAIHSTAEGLEFFMSKGICPRFTVWCVEPNTALSLTNMEPPPLEYFINLLQIYRDTHRKYKLPVPPGYGLPGIGKAVFSVSAFMDVL